jgi:flagellar biosynthetic protein FlhB
MSTDDAAEKSHQPTPRKLQQQRAKGEMPRSVDLHVAAAYGGMVAALFAVQAGALSTVLDTLTAFFDKPADLAQLAFNGENQGVSQGILSAVARTMLVLVGLPAALVAVSLAAQQAVVIAPEKLQIRLSRISILANAKQKFGTDGLFEFAKSAVKLLTIGTILAVFIITHAPDIAVAALIAPRASMAFMVQLMAQFVIWAGLVALAIGLVDFFWQRHSFLRRNMMSFQELKEENKETEGDPHVKQARRTMAEKLASQKGLQDVPSADVVIVNPTHVAVALKWSRAHHSAPVCVAKGVDEMALTIRRIAKENNVPLHHDVATARALFSSTEIGQEVPVAQYAAVAAAIRFSDELRKKGAWR